MQVCIFTCILILSLILRYNYIDIQLDNLYFCTKHHTISLCNSIHIA